jgi:hypothetical protein
MIMRPILRTLLATAATLALAGCGSGESSTSMGGASGPSGISGPEGPGPGPVPGARVRLVSMTGGGGRVSREATLLDTRAHVRDFITQFRLPGLPNQIHHAVAEAKRSGYLVYGAVVAVGCDRPPSAGVSLDEDGRVLITAGEVVSPLPECLAAVTTVAIASVPGAD